MNTQPTPETDAFVQDYDFQPTPPDCLNLASRFERERDDLSELLAEEQKLCRDLNDEVFDYADQIEVLRRNNAKLKSERDEAREQRDALLKMNEVLCQFMNDEFRMTLGDPRLTKLQAQMEQALPNPIPNL